MSEMELRHQRKRSFEQYAYWSERAREIAGGPFGRESESYRAACQCAHRWLGRYDAYSEMLAFS